MTDCDMKDFNFEVIMQQYFQVNYKLPGNRARLIVASLNTKNKAILITTISGLVSSLNDFFNSREKPIYIEQMYQYSRGFYSLTEYGKIKLQEISKIVRTMLSNETLCINCDDLTIKKKYIHHMEHGHVPIAFNAPRNILILVQDWFTKCDCDKCKRSKDQPIDINVFIGLN
ncbi:hypothetical protein EDEG_03353 [Edhazardia aedis USNM 41457]|uniref:Uncharacterized protein n=1 Tax=Edhazardia aedis (strain USNM 41457) TaxID=1003232 RepID=J9D3S9_EDHAE|nr:hypothetical protein EDEG_03353 [Edhazardia aedis USNM 41457]|eukprot:EJW02199.1 hypothetical protein EDEG_03353 [Edhazardia aedis USNM 41457]